MLLLGIDLETITFEEAGDRCIAEIGAALWDTDICAPVGILSVLVNEPDRPTVSENVTQLTGLTEETIIKFGWVPSEQRDGVSHQLIYMLNLADYFVAHNGTNFDKPILKTFLAKYYYGEWDTTWIDTCIDIEYPVTCTNKNLTYLCGFHGFVNPFPHRAITDVLSMLKILTQYPLDRVVEVAESPLVRVIASVSYENRQQAKDHKFYWNPEKKIWYLDTKKIFLEGKTFPFGINIIKPTKD